MARQLTPEELEELIRAERMGGIPNVRPDSSIRFEGRPILGERKPVGMPGGGLLDMLKNAGGAVKRGLSGLLGSASTRSGVEMEPQYRAPELRSMLVDSVLDTVLPQAEASDEPEFDLEFETELDLEADKLYTAIFMAEHRSIDHRRNPFIRTEASETPRGSSAYGPLQITKGMMETTSKKVDLTSEERDYVNRFLEQGRKFLKYGNNEGMKGYEERYDYGGSGDLDSPEDRALYESVAKKLIRYYIDEHGDPVNVASKWKYGPNTDVLITDPDTEDHKHADYYREFNKIMRK